MLGIILIHNCTFPNPSYKYFFSSGDGSLPSTGFQSVDAFLQPRAKKSRGGQGPGRPRARRGPGRPRLSSDSGNDMIIYWLSVELF